MLNSFIAKYLEETLGMQEMEGELYHQLPVAALVEIALANHDGVLSDTGALVVNTGKYTGRSPDDRYIADTPDVHDSIDWGKANRPISSEQFDRIYNKTIAHLSKRDKFVFDGYAGADPGYSLRVRVVTELASHSLFAHQMLIRPSLPQLLDFEPEFTLINAVGLSLNSAEDGTHSEAGIFINFQRKIILIVSTRYAGEMKKSIFSVLNYLMPERGVFPTHCAANLGHDGRSALFFGLSGTGKTTLSADPNRYLIGDDEHGWSESGIFNFEGGCYAKAIGLTRENEPQIYDAIRFGAMAENVKLDDSTRTPDFNSDWLTENTRVAYPVEFIPNADVSGMAPHPSTIIFLTADAFGVLPPISKLTAEQAQYHFISGYTSKVAGTERDVTEPKAVFSTCFGAPFMPRPSLIYADLLKQRIEANEVNVYLINTGWQGGCYGVGKRIPIQYTRAMVTAALEGSIELANFTQHPIFNVMVPDTCPGVPSEMLDPRNGWADSSEYDHAAIELAGMFIQNFKQFNGIDHLAAAGPRVISAV